MPFPSHRWHFFGAQSHWLCASPLSAALPSRGLAQRPIGEQSSPPAWAVLNALLGGLGLRLPRGFSEQRPWCVSDGLELTCRLTCPTLLRQTTRPPVDSAADGRYRVHTGDVGVLFPVE